MSYLHEYHISVSELLPLVTQLLENQATKRIIVVGTSCTGKSTLVKLLPGAIDMDVVLFPQLSQAEKTYICSDPWTPEIGEYVTKLVNEKMSVEAGKPVFGTVVLPCDLLICITLEDTILEQRVRSR